MACGDETSSDEFRCTPEGRLRVYRTRNVCPGKLTRGLPQRGAYETVLRDEMARTRWTLLEAGIDSEFN